MLEEFPMKRNHAGRKLASNFEACGEAKLNEEIKNGTDMIPSKLHDLFSVCVYGVHVAYKSSVNMGNGDSGDEIRSTKKRLQFCENSQMNRAQNGADKSLASQQNEQYFTYEDMRAYLQCRYNIALES